MTPNPNPPGTKLLRLIARVVPESHRDEWFAEWLGEVDHAWRHDGSAPWRLRLRCLGAVTDALWLWRRHRRPATRNPNMLTRDVHFAVRSLRRKPGFTMIAVSTLALCIGATTAVFSIVESVLLNGLPYRQLGQLAAVWSNNPKEHTDRYEVSVGDYFDWRQRSHSFGQLAGFFPTWNVLYSSQDGTVRADVGAVTANFLPTLGVTPTIGRGFAEGEDKPGAPGTVVLSHAFWSRVFQRDSGVIGKSMTLDGQPYTVIGVMDENFVFPQSTVDVLMPLSVLGSYWQRRGVHLLSVVGRLRPGVTFDAARREMASIGKQLEQEHSKEDAGLGITVKPLTDDLLGDVRRPILVLFAAVCAVLLIGCANVTSLFLARAGSRRQELGVRVSMGAQPGAIVQQLLVESAVIAIVSGALGVLVALLATRALGGMMPVSISQIGRIRIDGYVLGFTVVVSILVTVLCGTAPALTAARGTVRGIVGDSGRISVGRGGRRLYRMLVVGELATALVLAVSAGLLINSFARLTGADPGFRRSHVIKLKMDLPSDRYPQSTLARRDHFFQSVLEQVRALPGVTTAGIVNRFPLHESNITTDVLVEGLPRPADGQEPSANLRSAGHDYFKSMGIPLVAGRDFAASDADSASVAIISQTAVALFGTSSPIGHRFTLGSGRQPITVIGVVRDMHDASLREAPRPQIFLAAEQTHLGTASLVVNYTGSATAIAGAARRIIASVDRSVPVFDVQTIEQVIDKASMGDRFTMVLLSGFSLLALMLAALGTYGVMAVGVTERTREIGVRMALGARTNDVLGAILFEGLSLLGIAVPIALAGVWATARVLQGLLFGVGATDPTTIALSVLALGAATTLACYIPARRASRVDPTIAIRGG